MSEDHKPSLEAEIETEAMEGAEQAAETAEPAIDAEGPKPSFLQDAAMHAELAVSALEQAIGQAVRRESKYLLLWGAVGIILGGFTRTSVGFGILLVIVGGLAYLIADGVLFVGFGVLMAWAGLSNVLGGDTTWIILAVFQFYWAYREFQQFFAVRKVQQDLLAKLPPGYLPPEKGLARWFPLAGMILGILSIGAFFVGWLGLAAYSTNPGGDNLTRLVIELVGLARSIMILGLSASLGSLLARFRYRYMSIIGLVTSLIALVAWLWLAL